MTKLGLVFSSDPAYYFTDTAKIVYTVSYLCESAADWFKPYLNRVIRQIGFITYEAFVHSLKNVYDDFEAHTTAQHKLHNLKQEDKGCSAYYAEFSIYTTMLNYDDRTEISFFSNSTN